MQLWTVWIQIQIDYIEVINMSDFIELPDTQGYIIEIPATIEYSIEDLKRIVEFPEELRAISEMVNSSDSEIKMLGNELLKTLKDV